jgi:hypothetical protein
MEEQEQGLRLATTQKVSLATLRGRIRLTLPFAEYDKVTAELMAAADKIEAAKKAQQALQLKAVEREHSRADVKQLIV